MASMGLEPMTFALLDNFRIKQTSWMALEWRLSVATLGYEDAPKIYAEVGIWRQSLSSARLVRVGGLFLASGCLLKSLASN